MELTVMDRALFDEIGPRAWVELWLENDGLPTSAQREQFVSGKIANHVLSMRYSR